MRSERLFARGHILRFVNLTLLALLAAQGLTGLYALYASRQAWAYDLHRIAGWGIIALLPLKAGISWRSLRRGLAARFDRSVLIVVSLVLAGGLLAILTLGLMWAWRLGPMWAWLGQSIMAWHWIAGLAIIPLLALHVWRRWPGARRADFTARRGALKLGGLAALGVGGWLAAGAAARGAATARSPRRHVTGSRADGLFEPNAYPVIGEASPHIDVEGWRLRVTGAVASPLELRYDDLRALPPASARAELDCTSGWYTVQDWQGVRLWDVLLRAGARPEAAGVRVFSATGYNHTFPLAEAREMLLCTHTGDEALTRRHGYPLRVVMPGRRGWFWVKWVERVDVLDDPLDVVAGVLAAPRQVLRQW